jgi:hypothetical protein
LQLKLNVGLEEGLLPWATTDGLAEELASGGQVFATDLGGEEGREGGREDGVKEVCSIHVKKSKAYRYRSGGREGGRKGGKTYL